MSLPLPAKKPLSPSVFNSSRKPTAEPTKSPGATASKVPGLGSEPQGKASPAPKRVAGFSDPQVDAITAALHPWNRDNPKAKLAALNQLETLGRGLVPDNVLDFWLALERHRAQSSLNSEQLAKARITEMPTLFQRELSWMHEHLKAIQPHIKTTHSSGKPVKWLPERAEKTIAKLAELSKRPFSMDELAEVTINFVRITDVHAGQSDLAVTMKDADDLVAVWKKLNRSRQYVVPFQDSGTTHSLDYFFRYRAVPVHPGGLTTKALRADRKDRHAVAFLAHDFVHILDAVQGDEVRYDGGVRRSVGFDKKLDLPHLAPAHESFLTDAERYLEVKNRMQLMKSLVGWMEGQNTPLLRFAAEATLFELIHEQDDVPFAINALRRTVKRERKKGCLLGRGTNLHFELEKKLGKQRVPIMIQVREELDQLLVKLQKEAATARRAEAKRAKEGQS